MNPSDIKQRYEAARSLFQQGRHREALQQIQTLIWEQPRNVELLLGKALCLEALGRPLDALETVREAEAIAPDPRLRALAERLRQREKEAHGTVPQVDVAALLKQVEDEEAGPSALAILTSRRAYVVIFFLMFLLLASVGPMLWWGIIGRPGQ